MWINAFPEHCLDTTLSCGQSNFIVISSRENSEEKLIFLNSLVQFRSHENLTNSTYSRNEKTNEILTIKKWPSDEYNKCNRTIEALKYWVFEAQNATIKDNVNLNMKWKMLAKFAVSTVRMVIFTLSTSGYQPPH